MLSINSALQSLCKLGTNFSRYDIWDSLGRKDGSKVFFKNKMPTKTNCCLPI